jgi:hypothetical protein
VSAAAGEAHTARPFVTALRTRGAVLRLGAEGGDRMTVRVQLESLWDAIAVDVRADEPISTLVRTALARFGVSDAPLAEFITKLNGWEVKGADATVVSSGAKNGSTFLVAYRFRRPVR